MNKQINTKKSKLFRIIFISLMGMMLIFSVTACEPPPPPKQLVEETVMATVTNSGGWPGSTTITVKTTRPLEEDMSFAISFAYKGGGTTRRSVVIPKGGTSGSVRMNGALLGVTNLRFDATGTNTYSFNQWVLK
ncbi:MAG: hypothetical protein FWD49_00655 [Firmicutes bacterium]|nr:hypothetical protein [Bacillota bacterium]